ncbi:SDR family oxidoreductase [Pseudohalioglobus sediminis]|uniref:SDR family oxidoreductase n=1 Tax=Pseudohalioglobus sediminis TaxID=2606449 RepID=A0A5B0WW27_9GAMM|nr:SDR family oxidoreductase [Pseudohalioglobus sediminis]
MIAAGKVALVTGGASGMGQIFARRLAASGAKVAIFDVNEAGLRQTADADNITAFHCDIADQEAVTARVAEVEADLGPVELLVHAAALMPAYALADHSHENMEKLFRVNFFGTTYLCRAVLPGMQARGHGRIIVFG